MFFTSSLQHASTVSPRPPMLTTSLTIIMLAGW